MIILRQCKIKFMAYDEKYRRRVIEYKDAGHTFKEVYEAFGVGSKSYYQWKKQIENTGGFQSVSV